MFSVYRLQVARFVKTTVLPTWFGYWPRHGSGTAGMVRVLADMVRVLADMVRVLPTWFGYWPTWFGYGDKVRVLADMHRVLADMHRVLADMHRVLADMHRVLADMHRVLADMHRVLADIHRVSGVGRPLRVSPIGHHTYCTQVPTHGTRGPGYEATHHQADGYTGKCTAYPPSPRDVIWDSYGEDATGGQCQS